MSAAKVVGKPFSADYRITENAGRSDEVVLQSGRIYRDATGNMRTECQAKLDDHDDNVIAFIQIEPDGRLVVLDTTRRRVMVDSGSIPSVVTDGSGKTPRDQGGWFFYDGEPEFLKEHRRISNESCRLVRLKPIRREDESSEAVDSSKEVCWSDELQVALTDRFVREDTPYAYVLSNISRDPPPPSLFSIPAGFASARSVRFPGCH